MDSVSKLVIALAVPIAAGVAWITTRATTPGTSDIDRETTTALLARVERIEHALENQRSPAVRDDRAVMRRIEALESRLSDGGGASTGTPAADAGAAAPPAGAAPANDNLRKEVVVGLTTEPASGDHRAAVRRLAEHLVKSAEPPTAEKEFAWAALLLDREAHRERITPEEAEDLAPILYALAPGNVARPSLAKAVAIGWGRDERLGGFLTRFAANSEPSLHQGVLNVLDDEHPGDAFSEYVIRLVREERDPAVLATVLGLDRIEAAATATVAPRLAQTIETRVVEGSLDAKTRSHAGLAIAVACLRAPEIGVSTLQRLAGRETDAKIAERYRQAAATLREGAATLKSLERLFE